MPAPMTLRGKIMALTALCSLRIATSASFVRIAGSTAFPGRFLPSVDERGDAVDAGDSGGEDGDERASVREDDGRLEDIERADVGSSMSGLSKNERGCSSAGALWSPAELPDSESFMSRLERCAPSMDVSKLRARTSAAVLSGATFPLGGTDIRPLTVGGGDMGMCSLGGGDMGMGRVSSDLRDDGEEVNGSNEVPRGAGIGAVLGLRRKYPLGLGGGRRPGEDGAAADKNEDGGEIGPPRAGRGLG